MSFSILYFYPSTDKYKKVTNQTKIVDSVKYSCEIVLCHNIGCVERSEWELETRDVVRKVKADGSVGRSWRALVD